MNKVELLFGDRGYVDQVLIYPKQVAIDLVMQYACCGPG